MFRLICSSRCQSITRNFVCRSQRYQQTSSSPSSNKPQNSSAKPTARNDTLTAIVYGVALGLCTTILYAEYDNDAFRRKVESRLPFGSTILNGLDKIIDPIFGRKKS